MLDEINVKDFSVFSKPMKQIFVINKSKSNEGPHKIRKRTRNENK